MKQFALVLVPVYNSKSSKTQSFSKQKLPKYQADQKPRYQINIVEKWNKQKLVCQSRLFSRQKFVLSADFDYWWCRNWSVLVGLCSKTASKKRTRSRHLLQFILRWQNISYSRFKAECQNQREGKLSPSQSFNIKGFKTFTRRVVLLMGLCAVWSKLTTYQDQKWDNFHIQRLRTQYFFGQTRSQKNECFYLDQNCNVLYRSCFCWYTGGKKMV